LIASDIITRTANHILFSFHPTCNKAAIAASFGCPKA
jgi:hypothetical protein